MTFLVQCGVLIGVYFWIYIAIALGAEFGQGVKVMMFLALAWWTSWLFIGRNHGRPGREEAVRHE